MNTKVNSIDPHAALDSDTELDTLRRQAKQRFMGAAVLVLIAVIAFPFVLDSQPRPLPANIVIDIPKMDAKLEPIGAAKSEAVAVSPTPSALPTPSPAAAPEPTPVPALVAKPAPLAFATPAAKSDKPSDGARAEALLSGSAAGQYVVQAGSFKEDDKLQAAMAKLTKAGIQHYTQAAKGKDGTPRTRLRLSGSFETREEANAAAAKVAKLGVAAIVLKP